MHMPISSLGFTRQVFDRTNELLFEYGVQSTWVCVFWADVGVRMSSSPRVRECGKLNGNSLTHPATA